MKTPRLVLTSLLLGGWLLVGFTMPDPPARPAERATYVVDKAHSQIGFRVRHLGISNVTGAFRDFEAQVVFDKDDLSTLEASATIDVASIDTGIERRDNHLRSADFFDAETYPTITFQSTGVEEIDGNRFKLRGDLTIKDVTKPVVLDAELLGTAPGMRGGEVAAFSATGVINRFDYGLTWNNLTEAGGIVVGEEVTLLIELEAVRQE